MLWPDGGVVDVTLEIAKAWDGRRVSSAGEANTWDEPFAVDLLTITSLNEPLMSGLVEDS